MTNIVRDTTINMQEDKTKIAIAEAVKEGMIALQSLGGNSYGIYFAANSEVEPHSDFEDCEKE